MPKLSSIKERQCRSYISLVFIVFCADGEEIFQKPKANIDLRLLSEDNGHCGELLQILLPGREKEFHLNKERE